MRKVTREEVLQIIALAKANKKAADLSNLDMSELDLREIDFRRNSNLSWANLRFTKLSSADLSHVNLRGADLRGAFLQFADLRFADFRGANLRDADLRFNLNNDKEKLGVTIFGFAYPIFFHPTNTTISIEDNTYSSQEWETFTEKDIEEMYGQPASLSWKKTKTFVLGISKFLRGGVK